MPQRVQKEFTFNNCAEGIYPLVTNIIEYVDLSVPVNAEIVSKLKMILVELLTNSLKHSGEKTSNISVAFTDGNIILKKTDRGHTFAINQSEGCIRWPFKGRPDTKEIEIYRDLSCILKAKLTDKLHLRFFIEELGVDEMPDISNLTEHFGFMIVTRACDSFEYEFNEAEGTNNFTVTIQASAEYYE